VAAAMKAVFVIQAPDQVRAHWQRVTEMLRKQFPSAVPVMEAARDDVLAFLNFPQEHWRKVWSTNPLERLNKEIKRRTNVVGIFPQGLLKVCPIRHPAQSLTGFSWSHPAPDPCQRHPSRALLQPLT
jgi:hypothetical protein